MKLEVEIPDVLVTKIRRGLELFEAPETKIAELSQEFVVSSWEGNCVESMMLFDDFLDYEGREEAQRIAQKFAKAFNGKRGDTTLRFNSLSYIEGGRRFEESLQDLLFSSPEASVTRNKPRMSCAPVDAEGHPTLFGFGLSIFLIGGGGRCGFTPQIYLGEEDDHPPILRSWLDKLAGGLDKRYYSTPGRMLFVVPFAETNRLPSIEGASIDEAFIAGKNVEVVTTHLKGLELLTHLRGLIADRRPRDIVIWPASYYFSGSGEEIMHQLARGLNWEHEQYDAATFALPKVTAPMQPETVAT